MKSEIKQAFDAVRAEQELKEQTRSFLMKKIRRHHLRPAVAAVICALSMLVVLGGGMLYRSPVAVISVDVNPSLELSVNRFDRVVSVEGRNADGEILAGAIELRSLNYTQAVERLLNSEEMQGYRNEDAGLSIGVIGGDQARCSEMMAQLERCAEGWNAHCYTAGTQELEQAHELGLSCGKYRAFRQLQALEADVTPEQVQSMTMREIRERIAELGGQAVSGEGHRHGKENKGGN